MNDDRNRPTDTDDELELHIDELEGKEIPGVACACSTTCTCSSCTCVFWDLS